MPLGPNLSVTAGGRQFTSEEILLGTNNWTPVDVEFYSGDSEKIWINIGLGSWDSLCTGTSWFDAMELKKI